MFGKKKKADPTAKGSASQNAAEQAPEALKTAKRKKRRKVFAIILGAAAFIFLAVMIANIAANMMLRHYIKTFDPVDYPDVRMTPVFENGHYTFTVEDDIRIMHITGIHIGGGFRTYKNDKKTIYEIITMLRAEKPDLVILGGDNTYCLPQIGYNGGSTVNNRMVARTVIEIFEHERVYFSTVFGNHDTEAWNLADRQEVGDLYMSDKYDYCIFNQEFTDLDAETVPSVTNQCIVLKNKDGEIIKLIMLIDSNAYVDTKFLSSVFGRYDTIHDAEIEWAADTIAELSASEPGVKEGEYLKSIFFLHIPIGEYRCALDDLIIETRDEKGKKATFRSVDYPACTEFVDGAWGEEKVCYGGLNNAGAPEDQDKFFEVLCDEMGCVDAVLCGHDHTNNAQVIYKGVTLAYSYSVDNEAYGDEIMQSGTQRGAGVVTVKADGSFKIENKNAYLDYGCDTEKFTDVYLDHPLYPEWYRTYDK